MTDDSPLTVSYPSVLRKKVTAAFDGGRLSSDNGVMLLALAERRRALAKTLAALIADQRDVAHITHTVEDVLKARMLAIACGYPDGNDFDWLRSDPAFKLACGRLPDTGSDLCSQPTISRWENAPTLKEIIRLTYALVDIWCWRRALLSADPHLRDGDWAAGRHDPAPRKDAIRQGSSCVAPASDQTHSPALARCADHHSRRQPLRPRGSDELVRGK